MEPAVVPKPGQKTLGLDAASRKRARMEQTFYSYIKKPIKRGSKILKIEIYDTGHYPKPEDPICRCDAEVCVQHVVKSQIFDDIYSSIKDIINKIQDELLLESGS